MRGEATPLCALWGEWEPAPQGREGSGNDDGTPLLVSGGGSGYGLFAGRCGGWRSMC